MPEIQQIATAELIKAFHPQNPRDHNREEIEARSHNLLWYGWLEVGVSINPANNYLVSGHGTVLSVNWLAHRSTAWFDDQLDLWQKRNKVWSLVGKDDLTWLTESRARFCCEYWQECPTHTVRLSEPMHDAMMSALNLSKRESPIDPQKLATLLAAMGQDGIKDAGITHDRQIELLEKFKSTLSDNAIKPFLETDLKSSSTQNMGDMPDDENDDLEDREDEEEQEDEEPDSYPVVEKYALRVSLPWSMRKKWSAMKFDNGIIKDTEAFLKMHKAFCQ